MTELEKLAEQVAEDQAAIEGQGSDTRQRVIRMGKKLQRMQKAQKKEQAETGQTWAEYCAEEKRGRATFPEESDVRRYVLIAKYSEAYESGMSIKEAYKQAGKWKKNGGQKPPVEKVTIQNNLPAQLGTAVGRLLNRLEKNNEKEWDQLVEEESWTDEAVEAFEENLLLCRQEINHSLKKLRQMYEPTTA